MLRYSAGCRLLIAVHYLAQRISLVCGRKFLVAQSKMLTDSRYFCSASLIRKFLLFYLIFLFKLLCHIQLRDASINGTPRDSPMASPRNSLSAGSAVDGGSQAEQQSSSPAGPGTTSTVSPARPAPSSEGLPPSKILSFLNRWIINRFFKYFIF